jgi:predicted Zn-ribbon and HTH transcriptional regulator
MSDNHILDKILEQHHAEKIAALKPGELVNFVLRELNQREREVLNARYGLESPQTKTLEAIGKQYGITRERVRQIEKRAIKKALTSDGWQEKISPLADLVVAEIKRGGYLRLEERLFESFLGDSEDEEREINKNRLRFLFAYFLEDYIEPVNLVKTERAWKIKGVQLDHYQPLIEGIKNILVRKDEPLHLSELVEFVRGELKDEKIKKIMREVESWEEVLKSYLEVSQHFKNNLFDKWGLSHWRSVNPRRMRDKIYLILQKYKQPMHFKEIARKINEEKFDNKTAHAATIHNELILDDRFVLVGRGIYALKEWGYKPGLIIDVIKDIFREHHNNPLSKEEIIQAVLKYRVVKPGSINLALNNRKVFKRLSDGRYALAA